MPGIGIDLIIYSPFNNIAAFGVEDLIPNIKKACAAGAIVAGTNDEPTIEKIEEIAQLVEVNPR